VDGTQETTQPSEPKYEPPKVESVLTAEELNREVLYAGQSSIPA
jgi:hypothetical protein